LFQFLVPVDQKLIEILPKMQGGQLKIIDFFGLLFFDGLKTAVQFLQLLNMLRDDFP
jgi:SNF family Na+-dependent transporter